MSSHKSTKKGGAASAVLPSDPESLVRFADLLKLRSLALSTQAEYLRYVRKLATRVNGDPAGLDEAQVREHLLHLKVEHAYSPSSMRSAVAAMRAYYGLLLGHDWKLFDLVRSPDARKLPAVLTREEIARLLAEVRERRFQMVFRLIYACGLRISEAINLEVTDIKRDGPRLHIRGAKGARIVMCRCRSGPTWSRNLVAHPSAPQVGVPGVGRAARWRVVAGRVGQGGRAHGRRVDPTLHAAGGRQRAFAQGHLRAHVAAQLRDAPARKGRQHPADLRLPRPPFAGDDDDLPASDGGQRGRHPRGPRPAATSALSRELSPSS